MLNKINEYTFEDLGILFNLCSRTKESCNKMVYYIFVCPSRNQLHATSAHAQFLSSYVINQEK